MKIVRLVPVAAMVTLVATGCGSLPTLPLPFGGEPTPTPSARATGAPGPTAGPAGAAKTEPHADSTSPTFEPFWVQNHRIAEMWSGPAGAPDVVSFGATSDQFCSFLVARPPDNDRLYVFNPYSQNYFWIDAAAIEPAGLPERRPYPKPANQTCAGVVYEG